VSRFEILSWVASLPVHNSITRLQNRRRMTLLLASYAGPRPALVVTDQGENTMRDMIEMAVEREAERLDAVLEVPEFFQMPILESDYSRVRWHSPAEQLSARGTPRRRFSTRVAKPLHRVD